MTTKHKHLTASVRVRDLTSGDINDIPRSTRAIAVARRDLGDHQNGGVDAHDLDESNSVIGTLEGATPGEFFQVEDTDTWWISEVVE